MSSNSSESVEKPQKLEKESKEDIRDDDDDMLSLEGCEMLEEPKDFYREPRKPTVVDYVLSHKPDGTEDSGEKRTLHFHLVASHPLWAHYLWNGGRHIADMIQNGELLVAGKRVFEFGAGAAVPSVVSALCGARYVTITDFPEEPLLEPIRRNVDENITDDVIKSHISVLGFLWGKDVTPLLNAGNDDKNNSNKAHLMFEHSEGDHFALLQIYNEWEETDFSNIWCTENYIHPKAMQKARNIKEQLEYICKNKLGINIDDEKLSEENKDINDNIRKCIISGFFF